ncbi:MAG TPA: tyrosine-protein phosphatase [Phycisphaerae bacterium]|nr:tyrosine-protein phosphatase [Phycisphaerae bacterium]
MIDLPKWMTPRRKKLGIVILALIVVSAAVLGFSVRARRLPKRFSIVEPGVLYRSSQPSNAQLENMIKDFGIKTVIVARESESKRVVEEIDFARRRGLRVVHIPIESRKPVTEEQAREFLRCVDDRASRPALVHCSAGRHRTGYLCGLYRIERQGWTVAQAVDEMLSFGAAKDGPHPLIEQLKQCRPGKVPTATSGPARD